MFWNRSHAPLKYISYNVICMIMFRFRRRGVSLQRSLAARCRVVARAHSLPLKRALQLAPVVTQRQIRVPEINSTFLRYVNSVHRHRVCVCLRVSSFFLFCTFSYFVFFLFLFWLYTKSPSQRQISFPQVHWGASLFQSFFSLAFPCRMSRTFRFFALISQLVLCSDTLQIPDFGLFEERAYKYLCRTTLLGNTPTHIDNNTVLSK